MTSIATSEPSPAAGKAPAFLQQLGLFDATMLVAGSMIGSGIFLVSADIARDVGSTGWFLLVWLVTGVMTILGALSYGELAAMMPRAGGQYVYLREAYSPLWGFLYGWTLFLVIQTGTIAAVAVAFGKFVGVWVPVLGTETQEAVHLLDWIVPGTAYKITVTLGHLVGAGVVLVLTGLNCLGIREGKWVQNSFTVAKTLALIALIVVGLTVAGSPAVWTANTSDLWSGATDTARYREVAAKWFPAGGLLVVFMVAGGAMVGSLFSSDAWNNVTFTAGEMRHPRRNLPLSLLLGTGMVITLYLLANVAYLHSLPLRGRDEVSAPVLGASTVGALAAPGAGPVAGSSILVAGSVPPPTVSERGIQWAKEGRVGTAVMELALPVWGPRLMALAIMISTFGCTNGLILSGARLYYAMARDGLFFRQAGHLNRFAVPAVALVLQMAWSIVLIFSGTYSQLLDYVIFAALLFYVLTVVGLFVLRWRRPDAERPYRAVGYPLLPAVYVVLAAVVMVDLLFVKPLYTWPGLVIVLAGVPVYFLWRRRAAVKL
jgi:APA family basic amino acid/polyamine antiporter